MPESHARLVIADTIATAALPAALQQESADIRHLSADTFGIDDARRLKALASVHGFTGSTQQFVVAARTFTTEAQNALLKLLEDPPPGATFWVIVPQAATLLPTLRSRLILESSTTATKDDSRAADFRRASYKERLAQIADLAKRNPNELPELVRALTRAETLAALPPEAKRALFLADRYVYNRGALRKMLLEEVALSLPLET